MGQNLNVRSEIKGVNREDIYEIPLEALREAVVNAIMHRDYRITGTQVSVDIFDDRVEVKLFCIVDFSQELVLLFDVEFQLFAQHVAVEEIDNPDPRSHVFVDIRGSDSASCRPYLLFSLLADGIKSLVVRHDEVGVVADE